MGWWKTATLKTIWQIISKWRLFWYPLFRF